MKVYRGILQFIYKYQGVLCKRHALILVFWEEETGSSAFSPASTYSQFKGEQNPAHCLRELKASQVPSTFLFHHPREAVFIVRIRAENLPNHGIWERALKAVFQPSIHMRQFFSLLGLKKEIKTIMLGHSPLPLANLFSLYQSE